MEPTLRGYEDPMHVPDILGSDMVVLDHGSPAIGDIILFTMEGYDSPILHRVMAVKEEGGVGYYATKGDNNNNSDLSRFGPNLGWVPEWNILGRVVVAVPRVGWFLVSLLHLATTILYASVIVGLGFVLTRFIGSSTKKVGTIGIQRESQSLARYLRWRGRDVRYPKAKKIIAGTLLTLVLSIGMVSVCDALDRKNMVTVETISGESLPNQLDVDDVHNLALEHQVLGGGSYFLYNILISVSSGGFLNSVASVEVLGSERYVWRTPAVHNRVVTFVGVVLIEESLVGSFFSFNVVVHSKGLLASPVSVSTYNLWLAN